MLLANTMDARLSHAVKIASASGISALNTLRGLVFETLKPLSASELEFLRQAKAEIAAQIEETFRCLPRQGRDAGSAWPHLYSKI